MIKRMLLPAALVISALGFGLTPKASAGWFRHDAVERHQRLERNLYYGGAYSYSNTGYGYGYPNNGYGYYSPSYSYTNGYQPNYNHNNYGNNGHYYNGGSYRNNGGPSFSNGHNNTSRQSGHGSSRH